MILKLPSHALNTIVNRQTNRIYRAVPSCPGPKRRDLIVADRYIYVPIYMCIYMYIYMYRYIYIYVYITFGCMPSYNRLYTYALCVFRNVHYSDVTEELSRTAEEEFMSGFCRWQQTLSL